MDDVGYLVGGTQDGQWAERAPLFARFTVATTGEEYRRLDAKKGYPITFCAVGDGRNDDEVWALLDERRVPRHKH